MSSLSPSRSRIQVSDFLSPGLLWLAISIVGALLFFREGFEALLEAWQLPEYSHGPLIPVLSAILFLRQLKDFPVHDGPVPDRWPGVAVLVVALVFGALGKLSGIDDVVAYALILWSGAMLLISFGWRTGKYFWPPVLHLVYMLPLPAVLYYKLSTTLQMISSEFGVWLLQLLDVPVYLEGNIIDLGVLKLHVAEACSGLRYLFPILSFSYIFAVLYRGPMWHKAVLLLAAVPITVVMNSVRIAVAGWIANVWGIGHLEGFTHFFEGWVIFMICVILLFILAWLLLFTRSDRPKLSEALDVDMSGLPVQAARLRFVRPSVALISSAVLLWAGALAWEARPEVAAQNVDRDPFVLFPRQMGDWTSSGQLPLTADVEAALGADDYVSIELMSGTGAPSVGLFMAWYEDQTQGGTHSPEVCLPGSGWEIAWLERVDIAPEIGLDEPYNINRAVIQKGEARMLAYYWFEQHGRHVAWDFAAKLWLLWDGITIGRTDGALVRLITPIGRGESQVDAEARLQDVFLETHAVLPRFVPGL
ncbi:exosortase D (VPLPA-CTERM-specific) [Palleronia aestuarii]|uniref:Exosortase D (VPLPA-CTERM-specific) n=1 Tax=Palleronia aestuarii TaxID=568105 RepID=A0A2W7N9H9_9RHOB|nr:VPLPA-CTERM-specific exosortase XrtD [Palleronia aestuarii]PZX13514.1 exosortase D (VPLPA-CTERM-specific) [Palleronia aestuarii]